MSRGTPTEARQAIKGLQPGDRIAWTMISHARPCAYQEIVSNLMRAVGAEDDVLIVTIPPERRAAVLRALSEAVSS